MPRSIGIFLLLSSFIYFVASSSLSGMSLQPFNTTDALDAQSTCTGFKLLYLRPRYRDCAAAIDGLSSSRIPGNFHARGAYDEWQLPIREEVDTCMVTVEMTQSSLGEPSSWYELKTSTSRLNDQCRVKAVLGDVTGGETRVGEHQWIRISIARSMMGVSQVAAS